MNFLQNTVTKLFIQNIQICTSKIREVHNLFLKYIFKQIFILFFKSKKTPTKLDI